jgi:membrane protease YdiL (CAAX protease family)
MVALATLATIGLLALLGQPATLGAASLFSALALLPVNIVSLLWVRRLAHRDGTTLREMIGFDRTRIGRDIAWGLLWIVVLWLPFMAAIMGTMFAIFGTGLFAGFETALAPPEAEIPAITPLLASILGIVAFVTFAPLNAPTEELVYRGYSQPPLVARWGAAFGVTVPAIAFGLQHIFFAATPAGMLVYGVAFFVWGLGSGIIYLRQGRLMPLIVAHFVVNLGTSIPALLLPLALG